MSTKDFFLPFDNLSSSRTCVSMIFCLLFVYEHLKLSFQTVKAVSCNAAIFLIQLT